MKKFFNKLGRLFFSLPKLIQILLIAAVYLVFQGIAVILIFEYSGVLGVFAPVILIFYAALLTGTLAYILSRREIKALKNLYGIDFVYKAFPKEKLRDERKAKRLSEKERRKSLRKKNHG